MAKKVISLIAAFLMLVSTIVIPVSAETAETTENGYEIPELCLRTNEPDVTN